MEVPIVVVAARLTGMPLNHELNTLGGNQIVTAYLKGRKRLCVSAF